MNTTSVFQYNVNQEDRGQRKWLDKKEMYPDIEDSSTVNTTPERQEVSLSENEASPEKQSY